MDIQEWQGKSASLYCFLFIPSPNSQKLIKINKNKFEKFILMLKIGNINLISQILRNICQIKSIVIQIMIIRCGKLTFNYPS